MQFKQGKCIRQSDLEERCEKCYQNVQPLFQGKKVINRVYIHTYITKISGGKLKSDQFLCPEKPKMAKSYLITTWISFLQNCDICFNQESLPITYYNFHHKNLVRPKIKSPNWQGSQRVSYKTNFSQKESMHLIHIKFKTT